MSRFAQERDKKQRAPHSGAKKSLLRTFAPMGQKQMLAALVSELVAQYSHRHSNRGT
jgi:hypothetical protein